VSTTSTKPKGFTQVKIVAGVLLFACHPCHGTGWIIMEVHSAVELPYQEWAIASIRRRQTYKLIQPHAPQSLNHKPMCGGCMHLNNILDSLGHNNAAILHVLSGVIVLIPHPLLTLGPEELVAPGVSGSLKAIVIGFSKPFPCTNMDIANIEVWQFLIISLCSVLIFPFLGRLLGAASS
jgi:hypothetical protein